MIDDVVVGSRMIPPHHTLFVYTEDRLGPVGVVKAGDEDSLGQRAPPWKIEVEISACIASARNLATLVGAIALPLSGGYPTATMLRRTILLGLRSEPLEAGSYDD
jgi:hypothetical protein